MKPVTVRFDDELYNKLKEVMEVDRRSFNSTVLYYCLKGLKATKKRKEE